MHLFVIPIPTQTVQCGYFKNRQCTTEQFLAPDIDTLQLEMLLYRGFRHFGRYFFRPVCADCKRCIPLRVRMEEYRPSRSARRLENINKDLDITITPPRPTKEGFALYKRHKKRFEDTGTDSYQQFVEAFYYDLPGAYHLALSLDGTLLCVAHFDETETALSAVYTYYDDSFAKRSLGTFAVYRLLQYAKEREKDYVYLGYYIEENKHMRYKARFYPNEISPLEGSWIPFIRADKESVNREVLAEGFSVLSPLFTV